MDNLGTLNRFIDKIDTIPASAAWYLADLQSWDLEQVY